MDSTPLPAQEYTLRSHQQMAAIRAPARQEILDVLAPMGAATIAELAVALARPADSLYYHVRLLQKAGLIQAAGSRRSGIHEEALYRTLAPRLRLAYEPGPQGNAADVTPIIDSMLRLTGRDFRTAMENPATVVEGPQRELWASRTTAWLSKEQLEEVNRHMQALLEIMADSSPEQGRLYAFTMALTPLERNAKRERSRNPR